MKAATPESTSTSKSIARGAGAVFAAAAAPLDEGPRADRRGGMVGVSLAVSLSPPRERKRDGENVRRERERKSAPFFSLEKRLAQDEVEKSDDGERENRRRKQKKKSRCLSLITFLCSSPLFSVSPSLAANRHARGKKTSSLLSVSLTGAPEIELESSSSCCLQRRETREREQRESPRRRSRRRSLGGLRLSPALSPSLLLPGVLFIDLSPPDSVTLLLKFLELARECKIDLLDLAF